MMGIPPIWDPRLKKERDSPFLRLVRGVGLVFVLAIILVMIGLAVWLRYHPPNQSTSAPDRSLSMPESR
jgi:hypothetical protein